MEIMLLGSTTTSLLKCYSNRKFDSSKWLEYRRGEGEEFQLISSLMEIFNNQHESSDGLPKEKKKHQCHIILACRREDGELEEITPNESTWYLLHVSCPNNDNLHF
jgi:hypothetical protein